MNDDDGAIRKRSVLLAGHRTSVSVENCFWRALKDIALKQGVSLNHLITEIDRERSGNLSSALRVFVLKTNGPTLSRYPEKDP